VWIGSSNIKFEILGKLIVTLTTYTNLTNFTEQVFFRLLVLKI